MTESSDCTKLKKTRMSEFDDMYQTFKQPVYGFAMSLTQNAGEADDLFQETWLRVAKNFKKVQLTGNIKSWLFTITANLHRDNLRKKKIRRMFLLRQAHSPEPMAVPPMESTSNSGRTALDDCQKTDIRRAIAQAVSNLPGKWKQVFVLKEVEGYQYKEVGQILGMPVGTVKSVNHRAIRRLRDELWGQDTDPGLAATGRKENEVPGR